MPIDCLFPRWRFSKHVRCQWHAGLGGRHLPLSLIFAMPNSPGCDRCAFCLWAWFLRCQTVKVVVVCNFAPKKWKSKQQAENPNISQIWNFDLTKMVEGWSRAVEGGRGNGRGMVEGWSREVEGGHFASKSWKTGIWGFFSLLLKIWRALATLLLRRQSRVLECTLPMKCTDFADFACFTCVRHLIWSVFAV